MSPRGSPPILTSDHRSLLIPVQHLRTPLAEHGTTFLSSRPPQTPGFTVFLHTASDQNLEPEKA